MSCLRTPQLVALVAILFTGLCLTAGAQIYVVPGGAGDEDGSSWANAFGDLQDAVDAAAAANADVWVAEGVYALASQVQWPDGIAAYGGFPEGGTWDDRDHLVYATILEPDDFENALIRMRVDGSTGNRLDGFTLRNATGFRGALWLGGYVWWGEDTVAVEATVANCTFINNITEQGAGISAEDTCTLNIENSLFINNRAEGNESASLGGAVLYGHDTLGYITNSVFIGNSSEYDSWGGGGAIFLNGPEIEISYCTIYGNGIDEGTGNIVTNSPTIRNSIIWGNSPNTVAGTATYIDTIHTNDMDVDPLFVNAENGDVTLQAGSPAINAGSQPWPDVDVRGMARPQGAAADIGAYERIYEGEPVTVPEVVIDGEWWSLEDVEAALIAAGLTVGTITQVHSDDVPEGLVMGQDPAAGSEVPEGSAVNLTVSRGPAPTDMPLSWVVVMVTLLAVIIAVWGGKSLYQRTN